MGGGGILKVLLTAQFLLRLLHRDVLVLQISRLSEGCTGQIYVIRDPDPRFQFLYTECSGSNNKPVHTHPPITSADLMAV